VRLQGSRVYYRCVRQSCLLSPGIILTTSLRYSVQSQFPMIAAIFMENELDCTTYPVMLESNC